MLTATVTTTSGKKFTWKISTPNVSINGIGLFRIDHKFAVNSPLRDRAYATIEDLKAAVLKYYLYNSITVS